VRSLSPPANCEGIRLEPSPMTGPETKYCPKCKSELPLQKFTQSKRGRTASYCKVCQSLYCRHHYVKNAVAHNARRGQARRRYRLRNRASVTEFMRTHPCIDCGESDPVVLELDHIDRESKKCPVAYLSRTGRPLTELINEIAKCVVRCVNCHRRRTARQFGWAKRISLPPGCSSAR
jgi:hypothetical protein